MLTVSLLYVLQWLQKTPISTISMKIGVFFVTLMNTLGLVARSETVV